MDGVDKEPAGCRRHGDERYVIVRDPKTGRQGVVGSGVARMMVEQLGWKVVRQTMAGKVDEVDGLDGVDKEWMRRLSNGEPAGNSVFV